MSTCRSCGQTIHWIELKSGKKMPCDMELVTPDDCEPGDVLVTLTGDVIKVTDVAYAHGEGCDAPGGYVSHFATCPQADEWRKK